MTDPKTHEGDEYPPMSSRRNGGAIPDSLGLDPALRDVLEHKFDSLEENQERVHQTIREFRSDVAEFKGHMIRIERISEQSRELSLKTLGYCQSLADRYLEEKSKEVPSIPPMRGKLTTKRNLDQDHRDRSDSSAQHVVEEIDMLRAQQKLLKEESDKRLEELREELDKKDREALEKRAQNAEQLLAVREAADAKVKADALLTQNEDARMARRERASRLWAVVLVVITAVVSVLVAHVAWK